MSQITNISLFSPSGCLTAKAMQAAVKGDLSKADAGKLQKHLMECPFCCEAIEGISKMKNVESLTQDLSDIKKGLRFKKYVQIAANPSFYYAAAASLVVAFAVTMVFLYPSLKNNDLALSKAPDKDAIPELSEPKKDQIQESQHIGSANSPNNNPVSPVIASSEVREDAAADRAIEAEESSSATNSTHSLSPGSNAGAGAGASVADRSESISHVRTSSARAEAPANRRSRGNEAVYRNATEYDDLYSVEYSVVEEPPKFDGGLEGLRRYIARHVIYPQTAIEEKIEGMVMVRFIIDEEGKVRDVSVIQGVDPLLDKAALNVIKALPRWEPGKVGGQPVKVSYIIPVYFKTSGN